jgi:hypothetical protein
MNGQAFMGIAGDVPNATQLLNAGEVVTITQTSGDIGFGITVNGVPQPLPVANPWSYTVPTTGIYSFSVPLAIDSSGVFGCTAPTGFDTTPPTVTCTMSTPVFGLNQPNANVSANVVDETGGSGAASPTVSAPVSTSRVGVYSVSLTGADNAGNTANVSCSYQVVYTFVGFTTPVDNAPVVNASKAGRAVPFKWMLTDYNGVPVTNLSSVALHAASTNCATNTALDDPLEQYATGSSGLQNLGGGYYQFNWQTPKSNAEHCMTTFLDLGEGGGTTHNALFQFN